jgi:carboxyl-terminal processing protease
MKLTIAKYYTPSGRCVQRLEYYDNAEGEKPKEISDSLLKKFKTSTGREVIDGRGIEPDITIDEKELSRLSATIYSNNLIFNYATKFHIKNPSIAAAGTFKLSDEQYNDFKKYVLAETFTYSTASEEVLEKMKKTAEEEGYYADSKAEYEALLAKVIPSKERDLEKFKEEIKILLENEIISRYYFQKGRAEDSFRNDVSIAKSLNLLKNSKEYNTILGK